MMFNNDKFVNYATEVWCRQRLGRGYFANLGRGYVANFERGYAASFGRGYAANLQSYAANLGRGMPPI